MIDFLAVGCPACPATRYVPCQKVQPQGVHVERAQRAFAERNEQ